MSVTATQWREGGSWRASAGVGGDHTCASSHIVPIDPDPQNCTRLWDECRSSFGLAVHAMPHTAGWVGVYRSVMLSVCDRLPASKESAPTLHPHMPYYDTRARAQCRTGHSHIPQPTAPTAPTAQRTRGLPPPSGWRIAKPLSCALTPLLPLTWYTSNPPPQWTERSSTRGQ